MKSKITRVKCLLQAFLLVCWFAMQKDQLRQLKHPHPRSGCPKAQKGCSESQRLLGPWNAVRPLACRTHTWETKLLGLLKCISPSNLSFGISTNTGFVAACYEVVEGSKGEVVTKKPRCWISPRITHILVLPFCWHVMNPTKPCMLSVELVQSKRTWFTLFHKKLLLIPIWKKSTFVFFPYFNFKNNACLHKSALLPHMVLIFLYESHLLLQTCADKVVGQ